MGDMVAEASATLRQERSYWLDCQAMRSRKSIARSRSVSSVARSAGLGRPGEQAQIAGQKRRLAVEPLAFLEERRLKNHGHSHPVQRQAWARGASAKWDPARLAGVPRDRAPAPLRGGGGQTRPPERPPKRGRVRAQGHRQRARGPGSGERHRRTGAPLKPGRAHLVLVGGKRQAALRRCRRCAEVPA